MAITYTNNVFKINVSPQAVTLSDATVVPADEYVVSVDIGWEGVDENGVSSELVYLFETEPYQLIDPAVFTPFSELTQAWADKIELYHRTRSEAYEMIERAIADKIAAHVDLPVPVQNPWD
jgi:hypothetical protein